MEPAWKGRVATGGQELRVSLEILNSSGVWNGDPDANGGCPWVSSIGSGNESVCVCVGGASGVCSVWAGLREVLRQWVGRSG